ncbi:MAG: DUF1028 domain-containing protein [Bacteroidota bacterium]
MNKLASIILLVFSTLQASAQFYKSSEPFSHTYSIVAIDPETGDMGVAVQSHWFSVGSLVIWGEAGVGVVATQSFINVSFGTRGLEMLKKGFSPQEVIDSLIASDPGRDVRQLAILDKNGDVAVYTGKNCIQFAGHIKGEGYSVQANLMTSDKVWPAMSKAFENSKAPLAERMMAALKAAENEGGDIRGKQAAAMMVVRAKPTGNIWEDRLVDLRIADHENPIKELERLLKVHRAYEHMNNGDLAMEHGNSELANKEYAAANKLMPESEEMKFWQAVTLANENKMEEALKLFKVIFKKNQNWKILTPRIADAKLLNVSKEDMKKIMKCDE